MLFDSVIKNDWRAYSVVKYVIKLIYRYLYKYYCIKLFILFLIIIIVRKIFFHDVLNKDMCDINTAYVLKQHISCQFSDCVNIKHYNDNIIYLNILQKQSDFYKNQRLDIYNYSVLSSNIPLSIILKQCSSGTIDINDIKCLTKQYPILQNLTFGQKLSCVVFNKKKIKYLVWKSSENRIYIYSRVNNYFTENVIKILKKSNDGSCYTVLFIGKLDGTFINSVRSLGLEENCVLNVIKALQYQLDFRKLYQGDRFSILVSFIINSNKKLTSNVIGARLYTSGKDYYIFQLNNGEFYNQEAIHLEDNFIRLPILEPYRISSNFNLNRLNPVTGQISPHAGVDFAVPIGTPVVSVGDGEVIVSKYSKIAGNYIGIKHNYQCITRYMHLKKALVKQGQKVKKGDRIAFSGNTGRSTGPHLHFEVWINHRPVNPLTAKILNLEKLLSTKRTQYLHQIEEIVPKLSFD